MWNVQVMYISMVQSRARELERRVHGVHGEGKVQCM